jgi:HPt (histidine-containing phosphotransfer) domain-containing protein
MKFQAPAIDASSRTTPECAAVWDEARLNSLRADVGDDGLEDLIRLFHADMPFLMARLNAAIAARDAETVDRALAALRGAASHLGLKSLAALTVQLRGTALDLSIHDRLIAELARARDIPPHDMPQAGPEQ